MAPPFPEQAITCYFFSPWWLASCPSHLYYNVSVMLVTGPHHPFLCVRRILVLNDGVPPQVSGL